MALTDRMDRVMVPPAAAICLYGDHHGNDDGVAVDDDHDDDHIRTDLSYADFTDLNSECTVDGDDEQL